MYSLRCQRPYGLCTGWKAHPPGKFLVGEFFTVHWNAETGSYEKLCDLTRKNVRTKRHRVHCTRRFLGTAVKWHVFKGEKRIHRKKGNRKHAPRNLNERASSWRDDKSLFESIRNRNTFLRDKTAENTAPLKRDAVYTQASRVVGSFVRWKLWWTFWSLPRHWNHFSTRPTYWITVINPALDN